MTVSENDLYFSVSDSDIENVISVSGSDSESYDVGTQLNDINHGIYLIAFLIIFIWSEMRIRNAVGRWFSNGKSD